MANYSGAYSNRSIHTNCQAPQIQTQTKACQRVYLIKRAENFKNFLPLFKEKNTLCQRTTDPNKNVRIDKFTMKVQFVWNLRTEKNCHSIRN